MELWTSAKHGVMDMPNTQKSRFHTSHRGSHPPTHALTVHLCTTHTHTHTLSLSLSLSLSPLSLSHSLCIPLSPSVSSLSPFFVILSLLISSLCVSLSLSLPPSSLSLSLSQSSKKLTVRKQTICICEIPLCSVKACPQISRTHP